MNVHHLELFYHVARHGGISRAVGRMPYGVQQPAVSSQLIQLERELGVVLFQRRPFELTRKGEELFAHVQPFFSGLGDVEESLRRGTSFLRIGAAETVIREYLPFTLRAFKRKFPQVRLSLRGSGADDPLVALARGELDLVVGLMVSGMPRGLQMERLMELRMGLLVPEDAPEKTAATFMKRHAGHSPLISLPESEPLARMFKNELFERRIDWATALEVPDLDLVRTYAAGGFGIGLAIDAPAWPVPDGLRLLPLAGFPKLEIAAFHTGLDDPGTWLLAEIKTGAKVLQHPRGGITQR